MQDMDCSLLLLLGAKAPLGLIHVNVNFNVNVQLNLTKLARYCYMWDRILVICYLFYDTCYIILLYNTCYMILGIWNYYIILVIWNLLYCQNPNHNPKTTPKQHNTIQRKLGLTRKWLCTPLPPPPPHPPETPFSALELYRAILTSAM